MNDDSGADMNNDSKHDDSKHDDFFQRTIGPLNEDVASPNPDLMAAAMAAATEAFAAGEDQADSPITVAKGKEKRTVSILSKSIAVVAAIAASLFIIGVLSRGASADITLGDVLDHLRGLKSFQLLIKQADGESEVLVAGDSVRWQDSDRRYRIARGSRLWQIDEAENRASDTANPWLSEEDDSIDLLALLGSQSSDSLRAVEAAEQAEHAGVLCNVFLFQPDPATSELTVRCYADAETNDLYTIACWKPGVDPATQPPLAELRLLKRNIDFDEEVFQVGNSLSKDGRIGQITQTQGLVQIRPRAYKRWTPVSGPVVLKPGDWVRTDAYGANAVTIKLTSGYRLIPGPGSMIEVKDPHSVVLHRGEANFSSGSAAETPLAVNAGGESNESSASIEPGQTRHFQVDGDRKLVRSDDQPKWLAGFLGSSNEESIGSLITKIDGRDVPLTVGYHKVKVEIRDQIARTTIEESFVNHTAGRLEGQFHFPLPQDASISGFGMWINGELIEADVVEKQRAREIYETILRERRDPGLLEWAGGNIFKARVFPILPHSEKRIKIVYTQVLPMRANKYRYSYALRSELLQKTPLRELSLDVQVSSALPLKSVTCPTHTVRTDMTENAASVEFSAQEYTPNRDFEVVCEVDHRDNDVVVVPHRRGDDGYFLAQITPPSAAGNWQRDILPNGDPVNVLLVCDTSGSMDRQTRKTQTEFVSAVLSALGENDQFNVAVSDVDTQWFSDDSMSVDGDSSAKVAKWLNERPSLGWTDLDRMAELVSKQLQDQDSKQRTHVIYVGDGIATARDANPQACAVRLRRAFADVEGATLHCVSIGSSFESGVLEALASIGGGSVRQIDGEQTSQRTALELLNEVMQPGLTDIRIDFRGIEVAAVYPQRLPNLAAGTQQIIVGRYLPTGEKGAGEIVITGKRNGEPVRYVSRITLDNEESGNSFIPRLWARGHLDYLLLQGSTPMIQGDVIALSEEFHIMTPYTSLLVLETDEDRERFGVKRRFQMRDGERFFADGRSKASFELLQKQMQAAGNWRLELRRQILRELALLGRVRRNNSQVARGYLRNGLRSSSKKWNDGLVLRKDQAWLFVHDISSIRSSSLELGRDFNGRINEFDELTELELGGQYLGDLMPGSSLNYAGSGEFSDLDFEFDLAGEFPQSKSKNESLGVDLQQSFSGVMMQGEIPIGGISYYDDPYSAWFDQLVPALAGVSSGGSKVETDWGDDVVKLLESLNQPIKFRRGQGVEITSTQERFDVHWDRLLGTSTTTELADGTRWVSAPYTIGGMNTIDWCDAAHRANGSRAWKIGRRRAAKPTDISEFDPGQHPWSSDSIMLGFKNWSAEIESKNDDQVVLLLTAPESQSVQTAKFTIDRERGVVLNFERTLDGEIVYRSSYGEYVEVAGRWWPQTIKDFDDQGRVVQTVKQDIKALTKAKFEKRYLSLVPDEAVYQLIDFPLPTVSDARTKSRGGTAEFEDYLVLILDGCRIQNWELVLESLEKLEAVAVGKPCLDAIRRHLLVAARRNQEALESCQAALKRLVSEPDTEETFLALQLIVQANGVTDYNERLEILDAAKPIFERNPEQADALLQWRRHRVACLNGLDRVDEAIALQQEMVEAAPWQYDLYVALAHAHANAGDIDSGIALLERQIKLNDKWQNHALDQFYSTGANILRNDRQYDRLLDWAERWMGTETENDYAYSQYLSTLVHLDRVKDANEIAKRWLDKGMRAEKLPNWELRRVTAAINFALGQGYNHYRYWMEPDWYEPLLDVAKFFLKHEHHYGIPNQILLSSPYMLTEEAKQGLRIATDILKAGAEEMKTAKVSSLVFLLNGFEELDKEYWAPIAEILRQRWEDATEEDVQIIGEALDLVYASHAEPKERVAFLQAWLKRAIEDRAENYRLQNLDARLLALILEQPWSDDIENAAFEMLDPAFELKEPGKILAAKVDRLQLITDTMKTGLVAAAEEKFRSNEHPEKLTRPELAEKQKAMRQQALVRIVERLAAEHENLRRMRVDGLYPGMHEEFTKWVELELLHYRVLAADRTADNLYEKDGDFGSVIQASRKMLGEEPASATPEGDKAENEGDDDNEYLILSKQSRQQRAWTILSNLAVRKSAPDSLASEVLEYSRRGMELAGDEAEQWEDNYRSMLLALDRPEELEQSLRKSLRKSSDPAPLQLMLARLLAEQGKIDEAIGLTEVARKTTPLSPADLTALADWYMVADRPDDYRQARVDSFVMMEENQIANWLNNNMNPWVRNDFPLPSELDENVLFAFEAVFAKSRSPESYCYYLRSYYGACRDFRLLKMVPDAVVGRTPQQIYPFLTSLNQSVLTEVRDEAVVDEIVARIEELRKTKTSSTDQRALDLLESLVKRRAAEVLNQPEQHFVVAIAAMKRAFEGDWAEGERLQMAEFLSGLGAITHQQLAAERLRQLKELHRQTEMGTATHFRISWHLAEVLGWESKTNRAIQIMEVSLKAYHDKVGRGLPVGLNGAMSGYLQLLRNSSRFAAAEELVMDELGRVRNSGQKSWLKMKLNDVRVEAYRHGAQISLGRGKELYRALLDSLLVEAELPDLAYRLAVLEHITSVFQTDGRRDAKTYQKDLRKYAFQQFPDLVQPLDNYNHPVQRVADVVHNELGVLEGLRFLVERLENYPDRFRGTYQGGFRQFDYQLGEWREEAKQLGPLEPRLLKLALAHLRQSLIVENNYRAGTLSNNSRYYWSEKEADFVRVANEVAAEYKDSSAVVVRVARYLFNDLDRYGRAIALMQEAREREVLSNAQELTLIYMLRDRKRWAEMVPLLEPLIAKHPTDAEYRGLLIKSLRLSGKEDRSSKMLTETEKYFREENQWTEIKLGLIAKHVYEAKMYKDAVRLYDELIPMYQRARPNQSAQSDLNQGYLAQIGGEDRLSNYYQNLARSHAKLRNTIAAVDAAAGGIVARGQSQSRRILAKNTLESVIRSSKDLDGLIAHLDRQAEEIGTDSALIRKAVGTALLDSKKHKKAIVQLRLAVELQPNDAETHQSLIKALDATGQKEEATKQMFAQLSFDRHNLELYKRLAKRLVVDPALGERAATSLIEAAPLEAENHQALAELREEQDRWDEAIDHWQQVAELRKLEPTGLVNLATAQIHEEEWADAKDSIRKLTRKEWPSRFSELKKQIRELEKQLPK